MKITVVGSGYVGLVVGACLADVGNLVECVDIDAHKIALLQQAEIPFFEPGLSNIIARNVQAKRLLFSTDVVGACHRGAIIFIAVGTPQGDDGSAELKFVYTVAEQIADVLHQPTAGAQVEGLKIILTKSTVPIGTSDQVQQKIAQKAQHPFVVCSNPEFLKEGDAVNDFLKPDRIILGVPQHPHGQIAEQVIRRLYSSFYRTRERLQVMDVRSSEMTKYAANAMLATKISFMNELALLAEKVGADIEKVRVGIGSDPRIGYSFLFAGTGYGGSCFPKDVKALTHLAQHYQQPLQILTSVDQVNHRQKEVLFNKAMRYFQQDLQGKSFALWGLAFKPRTDDIRQAPSLTLIKKLIQCGASVKAYDPKAMDNIRTMLTDEIQSGHLTLCQDHYQCTQDADALFVVTEWRIFHHPDFEHLAHIMKNKVIFDGRNLYQPQTMQQQGWNYFGVGRGASLESDL